LKTNVMITIISNFRQFWAKNIGIFLGNQCYDQYFALQAVSVFNK
jgi:hypothetical protein